MEIHVYLRAKYKEIEKNVGSPDCSYDCTQAVFLGDLNKHQLFLWKSYTLNYSCYCELYKEKEVF
jgi:hypothetical protein